MNLGRKVILEAGLLAVTIFAPLAFGLVYPWGAMTASGVLFLLAFFHPEIFQEIFNLPRYLFLVFVLLFFHIALQVYFTSLQPYATAYELLKWLAGAVLFLLIQRLPSSGAVHRLLFILVLAGLAGSVYGLYEVKSGHDHVLWQAKESYQGFVTGTYLNRNHFAGFLELCLGVQLGFLVKTFRQKSVLTVLFGISTAVLLTALLHTGSRMGLFSFLFALMAALGFMEKSTQKKYWIAGLALIVPAAIFFLGGNTFLSRFDFSEGLKNFDGGRGILWQNALAMLKDHWLLGSGLGTFQWVFPSYQAEKFLMGWNHAHQDYLELAIELGIPAFLMLAASLALFIVKMIQNLEASAAQRPLAWGALVSILSLVFHGFADFNFAIPANAFLFILVLASVYRLERGGEE